MSKLLEFSKQVLQYGCILHCVIEYGGGFVVCQGPSMKPTLKTNDIVLTERISVLRNNLQKGDIVIVKSPKNPNTYICKRIVAMEGDKVYTSWRYKRVPRGHVWLEGDNKEQSSDSRDYGSVPYGLIRSRVFFKFYPFHDMGSLRMPGNF